MKWKRKNQGHEWVLPQRFSVSSSSSSLPEMENKTHSLFFPSSHDYTAEDFFFSPVSLLITTRNYTRKVLLFLASSSLSLANLFEVSLFLYISLSRLFSSCILFSWCDFTWFQTKNQKGMIFLGSHNYCHLIFQPRKGERGIFIWLLHWLNSLKDKQKLSLSANSSGVFSWGSYTTFITNFNCTDRYLTMSQDMNQDEDTDVPFPSSLELHWVSKSCRFVYLSSLSLWNSVWRFTKFPVVQFLSLSLRVFSSVFSSLPFSLSSLNSLIRDSNLVSDKIFPLSSSKENEIVFSLPSSSSSPLIFTWVLSLSPLFRFRKEAFFVL